MTDIKPNTPWHALPSHEIADVLNVNLQEGLTEQEASSRLKTFGKNIIPRAKGKNPILLFLQQFNDPLLYVLMVAATLAMIMGKFTDGAVVWGVVIINGLIGFVQEFKANKAIAALTDMVPEKAMVLRAGKKHQISASDIVVGDIVLLQSGDKVPADMRLIQVKNLQVEEAALTGESVPIAKQIAVVPEDTLLADRKNMVFSGTLVNYGTATAVVTSTGAMTELGKISALLQSAPNLDTPLTKQIAIIGKWLTVAICLFAAIFFAVGLWRGYGWLEASLAGISLAVGAIPEGLPAVITIALAIGVRRMAAQRAIIRRLPAVETLGSTTIICSDKTGTLTRNEMTVQQLWIPAAPNHFSLSGTGYLKTGELLAGQQPIQDYPKPLYELLLAGLLCNDAELSHEKNNPLYDVQGDPTEGAMLVAAEKCRLDVNSLRQQYSRVDSIAFESENQYMATLHRFDNENVILLKGAPEVILQRCVDINQQDVLNAVTTFAQQGMRVLAIARKTVTAEHHQLNDQDILQGFSFLGLQAMIDPPRQEAIEAVAQCYQAGIQVKMITGDHKLTAQAIAKQLGLKQIEKVITGVELESINDADLPKIAAKCDVFARVAPIHKLRLVKALQQNHQIVAMTGDGVNDAPALKQADIGVAMGITGTAVAKEAADMVLADDNFASIAKAVWEGRRVYDNLIKALAFILPTNLGLALILGLAIGFFPVSTQTLSDGTIITHLLTPILPTQILWINLVASIALALPLAFETMEPGIMHRPPRDPKAPLFSGFVVFRTILVAILMTAGSVSLFLWEYFYSSQGMSASLPLAQTMAVTTVIFFQIFYLFNSRSLKDSLWRVGLFSNMTIYAGIIVLLLLQAAFIYLPWMNSMFHSAPLTLKDLTISLLTGAIILPVISLEKWVRKKLIGN